MSVIDDVIQARQFINRGEPTPELSADAWMVMILTKLGQIAYEVGARDWSDDPTVKAVRLADARSQLPAVAAVVLDFMEAIDEGKVRT